MSSKGFASNYRIVLLAVVVFASFAAVGVRLVHLHVIDRATLVRYVDRARRSIIIEKARRGDVFDARGDILATSRPLIVLGVDPQVLRPEDEPKWPELSRLIGVPLSELERIFRTKTRPAAAAPAPTAADGTQAVNLAVTNEHLDDVADSAGARPIRWAKLCEGIEESTYADVLALGIKGVYAPPRDYARVYPRNQLAAHIVGFVNKENAPAAGVEAFADFYLRGQDGWRESEKDGLRRELAQFRSRDVAATDGYSIVLSIDSVVQHIIEAELETIAKIFRPEKATIIVSDPHSGFILGLANYPTFNLNEFNKAPLEEQKNVAITDLIEPGSTFKIVAAAGALEDGLVTPATRFDCTTDVVDYKGKPRRLMRDDHTYDHALTVAEVISHSSNKGAAQLAMRLGDQKFHDYARAFGFGEASGFPFGGEVSGILHAPEKWSGIDITRIPAGYSVAVTPLQIHYAMATIASGGQLMRPQIIREIRDARGETVYTFGGVARRSVISPRTAEQMARMLMGVVSADGTATKAAIPGYQVAGKTGTAQKLINGRYSNRNHVGSFVGFFPATRPQAVITVIVDDGKMPNGGTAYGSAVAVPSFKRVAEQLIPYLDIKPVDPVGGKTLLVMEAGHR
ncbi:MAG TPA: penicillin-binding protein 2 [Opitutaceae bacterium]